MTNPKLTAFDELMKHAEGIIDWVGEGSLEHGNKQRWGEHVARVRALIADEPEAPRVEQLFRNTTNGRMYRLWGDVSDCSGEAEDEKRMAIYSHHDDSEPKFAREMSEFRLHFRPIDEL